MQPISRSAVQPLNCPFLHMYFNMSTLGVCWMHCLPALPVPQTVRLSTVTAWRASPCATALLVAQAQAWAHICWRCWQTNMGGNSSKHIGKLEWEISHCVLCLCSGSICLDSWPNIKPNHQCGERVGLVEVTSPSLSLSLHQRLDATVRVLSLSLLLKPPVPVGPS